MSYFFFTTPFYCSVLRPIAWRPIIFYDQGLSRLVRHQVAGMKFGAMPACSCRQCQPRPLFLLSKAAKFATRFSVSHKDSRQKDTIGRGDGGGGGLCRFDGFRGIIHRRLAQLVFPLLPPQSFYETKPVNNDLWLLAACQLNLPCHIFFFLLITFNETISLLQSV